MFSTHAPTFVQTGQARDRLERILEASAGRVSVDIICRPTVCQVLVNELFKLIECWSTLGQHLFGMSVDTPLTH